MAGEICISAKKKKEIHVFLLCQKGNGKVSDVSLIGSAPQYTVFVFVHVDYTHIHVRIDSIIRKGVPAYLSSESVRASRGE